MKKHLSQQLMAVVLALAMLFCTACATSTDNSVTESSAEIHLKDEYSNDTEVTGNLLNSNENTSADDETSSKMNNVIVGENDAADDESSYAQIIVGESGSIMNSPVSNDVSAEKNSSDSTVKNGSFGLVSSNNEAEDNNGVVVEPADTHHSVIAGDHEESETDSALSPENGDTIVSPPGNSSAAPTGDYNEGVVMVKAPDGFDEAAISSLDYVSASPLYKGSSWYSVELGDSTNAVEAVTYLSSLNIFEKVDYDYVMKTEALDVSGNPEHSNNETFFDSHGIYDGWNYLEENGKNPGGSSDVVVAVIDTGVDYNHLDLRNNIWVNTAEIPDNGIDDDGNGYVDDIHGWNCVGDNNDPMDDNGHGTHVAGIIAAENNDIGTVGVAYNCKIMVIKAGSSSGYFLNSDIAEAIQYAYMNGASVINMSFSGYSISGAVEEVIQDAYNQCLLVAAAGNDARCNQPGCPEHIDQPPMPAYPAALPYVLGVMSTNATGTYLSGFSNFDHYYYNKYEYEGYACGENVFSTWPNNKYTSLSGTSMASPVVAGIAAVLRSELSDRDLYSNKYIQSQIVNTACPANLYGALTDTPLPNTYLYDYYVFDDKEFSDKNNGDGIINAGETIRLAVELLNIGGVATDVEVSIDTVRMDDPDITDPYFTILTESINLGTIGTYSVRDCGKLYSGTVVTGTEKYFEIVVRDDCPNDYMAVFNVHFTYKNGMNETDTTVYTDDGYQSATLTIANGMVLPAVITEDTVFPGNMRYIVAADVVIAEGVTVTFEPGAIIQFYQNDQGYYNTIYNSPKIQNYGNLYFAGSTEKNITIAPAELFDTFVCRIDNLGNGVIEYTYVHGNNICQAFFSHIPYTILNNSMFVYKGNIQGRLDCLDGGINLGQTTCNIQFSQVSSSTIDFSGADNFIGVDNYSNLIDVSDSVLLFSNGVENNTTIINLRDSLICSEDFDLIRFNRPIKIAGDVINNAFMQESGSKAAVYYVGISILDTYQYCIGDEEYSGLTNFSSNKFYGMYYTHATTLIEGLYDSTGTPRLDLDDTSEQDLSLINPFITSITMTNAEGNAASVVGKEKVTFTVTFNRPVVAEDEFCLYFGSRMPYADYKVTGEFVSDTVWVGEYEIKADIENGYQSFRASDVFAKDKPSLKLLDNSKNFGFIIDTTAAMSMNLFAVERENGIELTWAQDDYDTLLGYNIYRSEEKDGNFVKLNPTILLPSDESFLDENAEPGKTYWYTYTVVLSDFTESNPAGKITATAKDTMAPSIYHTPVNQGYENNNLVISCTASDNVGITSVTLYYRAVGDTQWKALTMGKQNDKYSAVIFGSDVTDAGIEYYIAATDGVSEVCRGSAEAPYTVVVKSADTLTKLGDVDGNGTVSTKDALMLMQCLNGDLLLSDDEFKRADLNHDGILSSVEALRILQYINGKVTTLEM